MKLSTRNLISKCLRSKSSNVGYLSGDFLCAVSVTDPQTQADKGRPKVALTRSEPPKMRPPLSVKTVLFLDCGFVKMDPIV